MRFAALVAGVCLALAPSAGSRAEPSLAGLLAAVRAAGGTPYAHHLRVNVSETIDGKREERELQLEGARSVLRGCDGIACRGLYFDGRRSYDTNVNDTALPGSALAPFEISFQAVLLESFADPGFGARGGEVTLRSPVERAGVEYPRVRVRAPLGSPVDVWIDPQSHRVFALEDDVQHLSFAYPSEPNPLPALPSDVVWHGAGGRAQHFSGWAIVGEPLAAPAGLAPVFAAGPAVLKMLPSRRGALPVIACTIGGRTVPALLDTGNSSLAMSLELAEQLDIEPSGGAFSIRGVGQYVTGVAQGPGFALGSIAFPPAKFALLHDVHRYGYDLVLGADAFAHARVTIDYAKQQVRFEPAGGESAAPNAVPLEFRNFVPVVHVRLGTTPAELALDTGDESTVNLAGSFYAENPALFAPTGRAAVGGIGGTSTQLLGTIPSVTLAGFEVKRQSIGATEGLVATADGHLGSGFLAHFAATFDYAAERVELVPRSGDAAVSSVPSASQ